MKFILEGKKKRPATATKCFNCGTVYLAQLRFVQKSKYCSRKCANEAKQKRVTIFCNQCLKEFQSTPSDQKNSKSGFRFCSRECKDTAQKLGGIKEIQPDHYGSGITEYRKLALEKLVNKCNSCGYNKYIEVLQVHHKDRNRKNNSIDNLQILCPTCHQEEHYLNSDGIFRGSQRAGIIACTEDRDGSLPFSSTSK